MKHTAKIQTRYFDTDANGHLSNIAYALYAETARLEALRDAHVPLQNLILARLAIDFRKEAHFTDVIEVHTTVTKLGRTSITLKQDVTANGATCAEVEAVVVHFDYATKKAMPIPDALAKTLA